jgi:hypothetical protein
VLGLGKEVEQVALVEVCLSYNASLEESFPALVECAVEEGEEDSSVFAQNLAGLVVQCAEDVNLAQEIVCFSCHCVCGECIACVVEVWKQERLCGQNAETRGRPGYIIYKEDVTHLDLGRGSLWSHRGRLDRMS